MSGGSKVKETTTTNNAATVQLPQWITDAAQQNYQGAKAAADANPIIAYTGQITPGLAANQQQASALASAQPQNGSQNDVNAARMLTAGAATGGVERVRAPAFTSQFAQQYMNPYLSQVQDATLREIKRQDDMSNLALGDQAQAAGAYGGVRHAVLEGEQRRGQQRNILNYIAGSNSDAYDKAAAQFGADRAASMQAQTTNASNQQTILDRMLQAGGQFGNIAGTAQGLSSDQIRNLMLTGAQDQQTQGDTLLAAYREFLRMQDAPLDRYRDLAGILAGSPRNTTTTSTGTGTSEKQQSGSLLNTLLGVGSIAASAFSDRRLKRDISLLGWLRDGLGLYRFRYLWDASDAPATIGVMADEVAHVVPAALGPRVGGFATVNYAMLREALA